MKYVTRTIMSVPLTIANIQSDLSVVYVIFW